MLPFEDRYTRQRQLREVGLVGQRRIEASTVSVGHGAADVVAAEYLERAGVNVERTTSSELVQDGSAEIRLARSLCAFDAPASYLAGALKALTHVRTVLGSIEVTEREQSGT